MTVGAGRFDSFLARKAESGAIKPMQWDEYIYLANTRRCRRGFVPREAIRPDAGAGGEKDADDMFKDDSRIDRKW